jgi:site-specific DNA-methyltransferase (adenine-specific)
MTALPRRKMLTGGAVQRLRHLPPGSIDTCVTSPPYYMLRDYGVSGQLGAEQSVTEWVDELSLVLRGVARVLKPTGSLWLNLGDSFSRHT